MGDNPNELVDTNMTEWSDVHVAFVISAVIQQLKPLGVRKVDGKPIEEVEITLAVLGSSSIIRYTVPLDFLTQGEERDFWTGNIVNLRVCPERRNAV